MPIDPVDLIPTPALYGVTNKLSPTVVIERWDDLIVPLLQKEEELYGISLSSIALVYPKGHNLFIGYDVFKALLVGSAIRASDDLLTKAIFEEYWYVGVDKDYWPKGKIDGNNLMEYRDVVKKWRQKNLQKTNDCKRMIEQWHKKQQS